MPRTPAILGELSATLPLLDYGRVARNSTGVIAQGFRQAYNRAIMPILKRDGARWGSPDTFAALHLRERAD
jgi:hypothetical protein